jgi:hypothetical protein
VKPANVAACLFAALAACVPSSRSAWIPTLPSYVAPASGFEVAPPPAWMRLDIPFEVLVITRDGTPLQRIVVGASEVGKPIGLGRGKRAVQAGMSPQELAELVIDDMRATEELTELRVIESAPATLSGRSGFRVLAAFHDGRGLSRRIVLYGLVEGPRFYRLFYTAPERYYFERDLPVFEEVARSFRLRQPVPARPR